MLDESNLHRYQWKATNCILHNPSVALWMDMGLGKTVSTLTAIEYLLGIGEVKRVLVIAPLRVALTTWPEEIKNWKHTQRLKFKVLAGLTPKKRGVACLNDTSPLHIINVDLVSWLVNFYGRHWPYDMVVIDESSMFKSDSSKRFRNLIRILFMARINRVVQLTGTPTSKGLTDLWSQVFLLDRGKRLGTSFKTFLEKYFTYDEYSRKSTIKTGCEELIYDSIADITLRLAAEDYLEMPNRIENLVEVTLPKPAQKIYDDMHSQLVCELEGETLSVTFAAAKSSKLCQLANGAVYTGDAGSGFWRPVHDAKMEALDSIISEARGAPVLIAYNFKFDCERIQAKYPNAIKIGDYPEVISDWNAGKIPILLAHPKSAGHGLNLQHGGNILVWFSPNWSLELTQQFNARLHRQGQKKPVFIHTIVARGTVDHVILGSLSGKFKTQDELLRALKAE